MKKKLLSIVITVLILSGSLGALLDNNNDDPKPYDGDGTTLLERPSTGNPMDFSPLQNVAIAAWVVQNSHSFKSSTNGAVDAALEHQSVVGRRQAYGDMIVKDAISLGSFKKIAKQFFLNGSKAFYRDSSRVKSESDYTWKDTANAYKREFFYEQYGINPRSMVSYIINEKTVLNISVLDENPENYTVELDLDPETSTYYYKREMKLVSGLSSYPSFKSVHMTICMNERWEVKEIHFLAKYSIKMLFTLDCTEELTEIFSFGEEEEIPEVDFYQQFFDSDVSDPPKPQEKDTFEYLEEALMPLVVSKSDFDVHFKHQDLEKEGHIQLDLSSLIGGMKTGNMQVNNDFLKNILLKGKFGDCMYFALQDGYLYFTYNEFKYRLSVSEVLHLLDIDLSQMGDLSSLLGNESSSFAMDLTKEEQNVTIQLEVAGCHIEIRLIEPEKTAYLKEIYIRYNDLEVTLSKTNDTVVMPSFDESYIDLTEATWLYDSVKSLMDANSYEIHFSTQYDEIHLEGTGSIDQKNNVSVHLKLTINQEKHDIEIRYIDKDIYLVYRDFNFRIDSSQLSSFVEQFKNKINEIQLPKDIDFQKILQVFGGLQVAENKLDLLLLLSRLATPENPFSDVTLSFEQSENGIILNANHFAFIKIDACDVSEITIPDGEIIEFTDGAVSLLESLPIIQDIINSKGVEGRIKTTLEYEGNRVEVEGNMIYSLEEKKIYLDLQITYIDKTYEVKVWMDEKQCSVEIGKEVIKFSYEEIKEIITRVERLTGKGVNLPNKTIDEYIEMIQKITSSKNGIEVIINIAEQKEMIVDLMVKEGLEITIDINSLLPEGVTVEGTSLTIGRKESTIQEAKEATISILEVNEFLDYVEAIYNMKDTRELGATIRTVAALNQEGVPTLFNLSGDLHLKLIDQDNNGVIDDVQFKLALTLSGSKNIYISITYIDQILYIVYGELDASLANDKNDSSIPEKIYFSIPFEKLADSLYQLNEILTSQGVQVPYLDSIMNLLRRNKDMTDVINSTNINIASIIQMIPNYFKGLSLDSDELRINLSGKELLKQEQDLSLGFTKDGTKLTSVSLRNINYKGEIVDFEIQLVNETTTIEKEDVTYKDLSSLPNLLADAKTLMGYEKWTISGNLNLKLNLGIVTSADVKVQLALQIVNRKVQFVMKIEIPYQGLLGSVMFKSKCDSYIYYRDGYVYTAQDMYSGRFTQKYEKTITSKKLEKDFAKDMIENIITIMNFTDLVAKQVRDNATKTDGEKSIEKSLAEGDYKFENSLYQINVNLAYLVGNSNLGSAEIGLTRSDDIGISTISLSTSMISIFNVQLTGTNDAVDGSYGVADLDGLWNQIQGDKDYQNYV